jgi:hypothetical protein
MDSRNHIDSIHTLTGRITMAKIANVVSNDVVVKNLQDLAMQHANALGKVKSLAIWALDNVSGFPEKVSESDVSEIRMGYQHKYSLDYPAVDYVVIEGNHMKVSDCVMQGIEIPKSAERVSYGVDFAFSFNQNEAGRLKDTHSEFIYNLVKDIRGKCNKYTSNTYNKLVAEGVVQDKLRKGIKTERKPNLDFMDWIFSDKGPIETMKLRAKNAQAKKLITADDVKKVNNAIIAFNVSLKK